MSKQQTLNCQLIKSHTFTLHSTGQSASYRRGVQDTVPATRHCSQLTFMSDISALRNYTSFAQHNMLPTQIRTNYSTLTYFGTLTTHCHCLKVHSYWHFSPSVLVLVLVHLPVQENPFNHTNHR